MLQLCAPKATFGSFLAVMFLKMTLNHIWPSRFGGLCSAGLPLAPQKPAAAAPATDASAALTLTGRRKVAPVNVDGLSVKVAKGEAATNVADAVLGNMEQLSTVIKWALESNAQARRWPRSLRRGTASSASGSSRLC